MLLPNNQRQYLTSHVQKDVLPYALCSLLFPLSAALASIVRMDSISTSYTLGGRFRFRGLGFRVVVPEVEQGEPSGFGFRDDCFVFRDVCFGFVLRGSSSVFRVSGFGCQNLCFVFRDSGVGIRVSSFRVRVSCFEICVSGFVFLDLCFGFRVSYFRIRVSRSGCTPP